MKKDQENKEIEEIKKKLAYLEQELPGLIEKATEKAVIIQFNRRLTDVIQIASMRKLILKHEKELATTRNQRFRQQF